MSTSANELSNHAFALCQKCGFDNETMRERVEQMDLSAADKPVLKRLSHQVFEPQAHSIIDEFYGFVLQQTQMRAFIQKQRSACPPKTDAG